MRSYEERRVMMAKLSDIMEECREVFCYDTRCKDCDMNVNESINCLLTELNMAITKIHVAFNNATVSMPHINIDGRDYVITDYKVPDINEMYIDYYGKEVIRSTETDEVNKYKRIIVSEL